jgi:hypothetical protein
VNKKVLKISSVYIWESHGSANLWPSQVIKTFKWPWITSRRAILNSKWNTSVLVLHQDVLLNGCTVILICNRLINRSSVHWSIQWYELVWPTLTRLLHSARWERSWYVFPFILYSFQQLILGSIFFCIWGFSLSRNRDFPAIDEQITNKNHFR